MQKMPSPVSWVADVLAEAAAAVAERLAARRLDAGEDPRFLDGFGHGSLILPKYHEAVAVTGAPELLIVMGANATPEQVDDVVARLEEAGCAALVTPGREATVIGAIGERELLAALPLEGYAGVEQVLPILKPYKLVSRELSPDPTVIEVRGRRIGDGYFGFIAGPVHGRDARADARDGARGRGRGRDDAPRRRVQAAHLAVRVPGARRGALEILDRGARGDRASRSSPS